MEAEGARRDYAALLSHDMRLAAHESWSEGSLWPAPYPSPCPCPDRQCYGCDALRVPDSQYEAVCGVPRGLAARPLSRSQSEGHGLSTPAAGGSLSHWGWGARCRSVSSLLAGSEWEGDGEGVGDGEGSEDMSPWPGSPTLSPSPPPGPLQDQALAALARQLQAVAHRPVARPARCKIPVLVRGGPGRRLIDAGDQGVEHGFADEYRPFNLQKLVPLRPPCRPGGPRGEAGRPERPSEETGAQPEQGEGLGNYTGHRLVQTLARQLHSKEQLLQECVRLIQQLTAGERCTSGKETGGISSLCTWLNKWEQGLESDVGIGGVVAELEGEIERLQKALDEKDRDVGRLGHVLTLNEETINMLNARLGQWEGLVQRLMSNVQRPPTDRSDRNVQGIVHQQRAALDSLTRDVEVLTESLLLHGASGGPDSLHNLCVRLQDKERLLTESRAELSLQSDQHRSEGAELRRQLAERERQTQVCALREVQSGSLHQQEMQRLSRQLKERTAEVQHLTHLRTCDTHLHLAELLHLDALVQAKDRIIMDLLEDAKGRDQILSELQGQVPIRTTPKGLLKLTL